MDKSLVEAKFECLDFVPLGVFVLKSDLTVLFWNTCLEDWTHIAREQIIGQRIDSRFSHLNHPKYLSQLRQIFEGGHSIIFSSQLHPNLIPAQRQDGQLRVQNTTVTAIPGANDGEFYALCSVQDVTDLSNQVSAHNAEKVKALHEVKARQRVELDLKEMNVALENAVTGISRLDSHGKYTFVNQAYAQTVGYSPDEMIDLSWQQTVHPDDLATIMTAYQQMVQDGRVEVETRGIRKDGSVFYQHLVMVISYNEQQQLLGHYCFMKDISDRKQAEAMLRRYERIVSSSSDLVSMIDRNYIYQVVNQTYLTWHQKSTDKIVGHSVQDLLGQEFFETLAKPALDRSLAGEPRQIVESWLNYPDAQRRYVRATYAPYVELDGTISGVVINVHDLTELKRAELENQTLRERLQFLLAANPNVIYSCKPKGDFGCTFISENVTTLLSYDPADFLAESDFWVKHLHPDDAPSVLAKLPSLFEQGHLIHEYRFQHRDGHYCWVQDELRVVRNAEGEPLELVGCLAIIDDRKQTEEQLRNLSDRLNLAVKSAKIGIWDWDIVNDRLVWDDRMYEIYGIAPSDFSEAYLAWEAGVHPEDLPASRIALQQALSGERDFEPEFRVIQPNGTIRYIEAHALVQRNAAGQPLRMTGVNLDISDRKQTETALRQTEATQKAIIQAIPDLLMQLHVDGTYINLVANHDFNICTRNNDTVLPPDLARLQLDYAQQALQSGTVQVFEQEVVFEGKRYYQEVRIVPFLQDEVLVMVRNITDSKQAENMLRQSEARNRAILSAIPDLMFRASAEGIYLDYITDHRTVDLVPSKLSIVGQRMTDILPPELAQRQLEVIQRTLETQELQLYEQQIQVNDRLQYEEVRVICSGENEVLFMIRNISDRKEAEIALQQQKELFQTIVDHIPVMITLFNTQGRIEFINPEMQKVLGWSLENWQHRDILPECYPDPVYCQSVLQHMLGATGSWKDCTTLTATQQQLETSWANVRLSNGLLLGIGQDISDRKRAEAERTRLLNVLEASLNEIYIFDAETLKFKYINRGALQNIGYTLAEMNQMTPLDIKTEMTFSSFQDILTPLLQHQQEKISFETIHQRADGSVYPVDVHLQLIERADERVFLAVILDITDRKLTEQALQRQLSAIEAAIDGIAILNTHEQYIYLNPAHLHLFGYEKPADLIGKTWRDLYPPDEVIRFEQEIFPVLEHDLHWRGEAIAQRQDGSTFAEEVSLTLIESGDLVRVCRDISDRKHKEIALRQAMESAESANLAKSMFLANMSHELRTPLNVILGFAQVMAHDTSLTPTQKEDLETIRRSGDHLLNLINDVLDLSKIESGHCIVETTEFDLIALLDSLCIMLSERATSKGIRLDFNIAPEVPQFILSDAQKLRQILLNLLSNAIKFTKEGSVTLHVSGKEQDRGAVSQRTDNPYPPITLEFTVIDTGVGIAPEDLDTIFDAFIQAKAGRKSSANGTGLGLTISRRLLELMGGSISVTSIPGKGSTFRVTLPTSPTNSVDEHLEQSDRIVLGLVPGQPHRRILVVDDQLENRLLMVRLLTQLGLEVREATNGQEAIQSWQNWQPDLIWMDIRMPGLDGYEATKQIRAMEREQVSIIIALTAQASQSDRTLALAAGCNDYISKPFRAETLFLKMSEYLGLKYVYADSSSATEDRLFASHQSQQQPLDLPEPPLLTLHDLATLPEAWLSNLEKATICGNDKEILDLAEQVSSEFPQLATYLITLANEFQFEQILTLIHRKS